jgi:hypothetical protein
LHHPDWVAVVAELGVNTMLARVAASQYGAVSAAWNAAYDLGWGAGAIGIGMVAATAGYPAAFAVARWRTDRRTPWLVICAVQRSSQVTLLLMRLPACLQ